ncbi:MAG: hypothetical protein OIF32_11715, partial [Campylobacterales bacterium]|nr:hypothetical protein [Campylobacterales bacterium]
KDRESFRAIGETHRLYTRKINFEQNVRGHLFQERFFSTPLGESHFYSALRYVEQNPLKAKMVKNIYEYPYSSSQKRLGVIKTDPLLTEYEPINTIEDYEEFLSVDDKLIKEVREKTKTGRPCGDLEFYSKIESITGREDLLPKKAGRPKSEKNQYTVP